MAPAVVHTTTNFAAAATSVTVTVPSTTAGNLLVVAVYCGGDASLQTISTVKLGTTSCTLAKATNNALFVDAEVWYLASIASGQTSVVVTATGASELAAACYEISGCLTASPLDKTQGAATTSSLSWTSNATAALAQSSEIAVGVVGGPFGGAGATITGPGGTWVNTSTIAIGGALKNVAMAGTDIVTALTALTYNGTASASGNSCAVIATFKSATVAVALTTPNLVLGAPLVTPTAGATVALTTPSLVLAAPLLTPSVFTPPLPFPQGPLGLEADVYLGTWTTATTYVYQRTPVQITRGRPNEGAQISPCQATMTVNNRDGRWTIRNPVGAWYGQLVQNTPLRLSVPYSLAGIDCYLRMETDQASYISCPDSTGLQITSGTLSVRIDCLITDYRECSLMAKYGSSGKSWALFLGTGAAAGAGKLVFYTNDGTTQWMSISSLPLPYFGARIAIRADYNISAQTVTFYTAPAMAGSWTQLGTVITTAATVLSGGTGQAVQIGTSNFAGMFGEVYEAQVLSSGTLKADPVFTAQTPLATSFADTQGNTWTLAGTAELSGRLYRFHGELSSLPRAADPSATDVYSAATATGTTSRLQQAQTPADSAMKRAYLRLPSNLNLAAYWPAEDAAGATQIGQAVGNHAMTAAGLTMASSSVFAASAAVPVMNGASATGTVDPNSVSWTDNVVRFLLAIPAAGDTTGVVATVTTTGTVATYTLTYTDSAGGTLTMTGYNAAGGVLFTLGPFTDSLSDGFNGQLIRVSMDLRTSGSNITYQWQTVAAGASFATAPSGTLSTATVGAVTGVTLNPGGALTTTAFGHVSVQGVWDSLFDIDDYQTPAGTFTGALNAWYGEPAAVRYSRLCGEEGISCRIIGPPETTQPMGNQTQQTIAALLQEVETTDQGMQFEPRQVLGLGYVTRGALTHPAVMASADYSLAQIAAAFSPSSDTQLLLNDVTMTAADGSTARQVLATGSLSVQSPPSGAGRFDTQVTVNPENDSQLNSLAGWFLSVRSFDDDRYPVIPFDMARTETPDTIPLLDIGSFLELVNTPQWVPPGPVKQLCAGFTETLGPFGIWTIGVNGIPETPYETAVLNDPVYGHLDTAGSTLTTGISSSAASMSVTTSLGPIWTTAAGDFPFDVRMTGEQITVTNITGASSPQTFTITRSVNGVAKSHLAGEAISLYHPMILAL